MLCFQRNWFRADLCEMARSCSNLQQVDKLHKYVENSTIKVFYWDPLRVPRIRKNPPRLRRIFPYLTGLRLRFAIITLPVRKR